MLFPYQSCFLNFKIQPSYNYTGMMPAIGYYSYTNRWRSLKEREECPEKQEQTSHLTI